MSSPGRTYRFHPLERRGIVFGLAASQVVTLAAGAGVAVVAVHAGADPALPVAALAAAVVVSLLPVGGRVVLDWAPLTVGWAARRSRPRVALPGQALPPPGVRIVGAAAAPGEPDVGVVEDHRHGTCAAVLRVEGPPFALVDGHDQSRQLAAWGAVLASTTRPASPVHRVQWLQRTCLADVATLRAHAASRRAGSAPLDAARSYDQLLAGASRGPGGYEVLIVLAVHPRRAGRQLRSFGSGRAAVHGLLRRELRLLIGQLRSAGIESSPPLGVAELAAAVRGGYEPRFRSRRAAVTRRPERLAAGAADRGGDRGGDRTGDRTAWPVAWREGWGEVLVDGRWHATGWVAEWPRGEVGPDFLTPLLMNGAARSVSVTMAPVPARLAARHAESARTAEVADEELRRRTGFVTTARSRRRAEGIAVREAELADGHGELRFSGYVTVSGANPAELDAAVAAVEAAAQQCGLELRRLYGQQQEALTWTLPLGRGLA